LASIPYLVRNVFEHIKEKNDIKSVSELGISLVNIVTTDSAALTHIAFQPVFIKIETPSLPSHILSQPVAAASPWPQPTSAISLALVSKFPANFCMTLNRRWTQK
jgi:hypothetical protein